MSAYLVGGAIGAAVAALAMGGSSVVACVVVELASEWVEAVRRARCRARQGKPEARRYAEARARYYAV